jgi:hypothetical protein
MPARLPKDDGFRSAQPILRSDDARGSIKVSNPKAGNHAPALATFCEISAVAAT